jgi:L-asparaginase
VPVVHIVPGLDERGLPDANRLDGVIVAGTCGGHVPPTVLPWLGRLLDAGKPVVLASRVPEGRILHDTYGGPGSERDLIERGCLPAGYLSAEKARLRLLVALGAGVRPDDAFPGRAGPVAMLGSTSRKAAT